MKPLHSELRTRSYERLAPQDAAFLAFEETAVHMSVGGAAVFESTSFRLSSGDLDEQKLRRFIAWCMATVPRCRQRLARIPLSRQPVWIDAEDFRVEDHVHAVTLDGADGEAGLKRLAGEIFSTPLDRSRPLWEITIVDGLADPDTFALVCKLHHCMIDGLAGMDFMGSLLSQEPVATFEDAPLHHPIRPPSRLRLLVDEAARFALAPPKLVRGIAQLVTDGDTRREFATRVYAMTHVLAHGLVGTSATPLSAPTRIRRYVDWSTVEASEERLIRTRLGGIRDDVTLAAATGAVRGFLERRGVRMSRLHLRSMVPVSVRTRSERGALGNRVSTLIVDLPAAEPDARTRLARISKHVARLKEKKQGLGGDTFAKIDTWTGTLTQSFGMWLSRVRRSYNLCVTTIPGSPTALYALESKLLALYPIAPIFTGQLINIAALSYDGKVRYGVHYAGDDGADAVRDFAQDLASSFHELVAIAKTTPPRIRVVESDESLIVSDAASAQIS